MYNQDLELDTPRQYGASAEVAASGRAVRPPERNRSLAVLKNAIDWGQANGKQVCATASRPSPARRQRRHGRRPAARQILGILSMTVMGGEAYISCRPDPVDQDGNFLDEAKRAFCQAYMDQFVALVARFADPSAP
jgi:chromate reductase